MCDLIFTLLYITYLNRIFLHLCIDDYAAWPLKPSDATNASLLAF